MSYRTTYDPEKKEWSGPKIVSIFNPKTSIGNVVLNALDLHASRTAQVCARTGKTTTYEELATVTVGCVKQFEKNGFQKGDLIYMLTGNLHDNTALVFAALCLGCPITAKNVMTSRDENHHFISIVKPKWVICDVECYDMLKECLVDLKNDAKIYTFGGKKNDSTAIEDLLLEASKSNLQDRLDVFEKTSARVDGEWDTAFIMQSSGTTGLPKGIRLSHAAILKKVGNVKSTDVVMTFGGLNSIANVRGFIDSTLGGATRVVNTGLYDPQRFFEIVEKFKVTYHLAMPYAIVGILYHPLIETADLSSLRFFMAGGSNVSMEIINRMDKYMKNGSFCHVFGMTELGGCLAMNIYHHRNNAVGQLAARFTAIICDDDGNRLGPNEEGELRVLIPAYFLGYEGDNKSRDAYFDKDGFFLTGDMGMFDDDGDLFIVDRKKEVFKVCGNHVIPTEVEAFINKLDGVALACVVGVPTMKHESLTAAVIMRTAGSTVTEETIAKAVADYFSPWKHLFGGVYFVDDMPNGATGKVARRECKQIAADLFAKSGCDPSEINLFPTNLKVN